MLSQEFFSSRRCEGKMKKKSAPAMGAGRRLGYLLDVVDGTQYEVVIIICLNFKYARIIVFKEICNNCKFSNAEQRILWTKYKSLNILIVYPLKTGCSIPITVTGSVYDSPALQFSVFIVPFRYALINIARNQIYRFRTMILYLVVYISDFFHIFSLNSSFPMFLHWYQ